MRTFPAGPVFDRAALRAAGWSDSATDRAVAAGRLIRVRRGWYRAADQMSTVVSVIAAAGATADSVVAHLSGIVMHGLPLVGPGPALPQLTVRPGGTGMSRVAHLFRASLRPEDVVTVGGVPVTSVARTLVDVARSAPLRTSVSAIDAALHRSMVTREQLDDVARMCRDWSGMRRADKALLLSDGRAESPLESISRLTMPRLGIPVPELQVVILDESGREVARLDFYWDRFGAAGEADGRAKYDGHTYSTASGWDVFDNEKARQDAVETLRMSVARWGWKHTGPGSGVLRERVFSALDRGRMLDAGGVPRRWSVIRTPRM